MIVELTVPFETNIDAAHKRKMDRYEALIADLNGTGFNVMFEAVEVGQRGQIDKANKLRLKHMLEECNSTIKIKELLNQLSKQAILASFIIFYSRKEQVWECPQYITL